jgi:type IV pilus assembly protein PilM
METIGFFKKDYIIGLDVGSSSIKLAQFIKREDGLHLVKTDLKEIKHVDDENLRQKETASSLKDILRGIDLKKSKIISTLNCPKTFIKKITVPYIPKKELREGLKLEAKNYFPFPVDNPLLDFEILGDMTEQGIRKYEVMLIASPRKTVDSHLALLNPLLLRFTEARWKDTF